MKSLKMLYTMSMDVHKRYNCYDRVNGISHLFNERLILSLSNSNSVLFVDDELNLLLDQV